MLPSRRKNISNSTYYTVDVSITIRIVSYIVIININSIIIIVVVSVIVVVVVSVTIIIIFTIIIAVIILANVVTIGLISIIYATGITLTINLRTIIVTKTIKATRATDSLAINSQLEMESTFTNQIYIVLLQFQIA